MEDKQKNVQENSKDAYCPNSFFDNGSISIGEFKTIEDAMNFPLKGIWCINRVDDNKFQAYKSQGYRILIICSWNRDTQDSLKFVVALINKKEKGKIYYWDMNDLPLYPEERKNQYEGSLGDDVTYILYQLANNVIKCNRNMNNKKQLIRLTESDLHKIVKESVSKILKESNDFKPTGYRTVSNLGGHEVQIHPSGDSARFKFYGGEPTDWLEIEFDEDGVAYVETERGRELLSDYMRY